MIRMTLLYRSSMLLLLYLQSYLCIPCPQENNTWPEVNGDNKDGVPADWSIMTSDAEVASFLQMTQANQFA